jgi:hypothetical protein
MKYLDTFRHQHERQQFSQYTNAKQSFSICVYKEGLVPIRQVAAKEPDFAAALKAFLATRVIRSNFRDSSQPQGLSCTYLLVHACNTPRINCKSQCISSPLSGDFVSFPSFESHLSLCTLSFIICSMTAHLAILCPSLFMACLKY